MKVVYSDKHSLHAPDKIVVRGMIVGNMEMPDRADQLAAAVRDAGHDLVEPRDFGRAEVAAVHTADYLVFLETAWDRWQLLGQGGRAPTTVYSHTGPTHRMHALPTSIQGQVGYFLSGGSAPVDKGTWEASLASAHVALEAAEAVRSGAPVAYALCRPPGHHAYADLAGGFCYLNNVAVAANYLSRTVGRAAIIDIDVHHGNGTQGIFYDRGDVHFVSIHSDPNHCYPFYAGFADERGEGAGLGHNLNLPLPRGSGDGPYLAAIDQGLASIRNYDPRVLLVSLGFDAYQGDPQGEMAVTTEGFRTAGARIGALGLPTVLVQEGGYAVADLGRNLTAFFDGFQSRFK